MLDAACTKFRTLVQELNIGMIMVSHLADHQVTEATKVAQLCV